MWECTNTSWVVKHNVGAPSMRSFIAHGWESNDTAISELPALLSAQPTPPA
jgi:hypothetical protein